MCVCWDARVLHAQQTDARSADAQKHAHTRTLACACNMLAHAQRDSTARFSFVLLATLPLRALRRLQHSSKHTQPTTTLTAPKPSRPAPPPPQPHHQQQQHTLTPPASTPAAAPALQPPPQLPPTVAAAAAAAALFSGNNGGAAGYGVGAGHSPKLTAPTAHHPRPSPRPSLEDLLQSSASLDQEESHEDEANRELARIRRVRQSWKGLVAPKAQRCSSEGESCQ